MNTSWGKLIAGSVLVAGLATQAQAADKVTVFAAASLTNAMQDIAAQYQKEKGVQVVSSFASSSTLARQIEQGAPADLFISADQQWMDYSISKQQIVENTRYTLLGNELVLVAAKASKIDKVEIDDKTQWTKLLGDSRLGFGAQVDPRGFDQHQHLFARRQGQSVGALLGQRHANAGGAIIEQHFNMLLDAEMVALDHFAEELVAGAGLQRKARNGGQQAVEG